MLGCEPRAQSRRLAHQRPTLIVLHGPGAATENRRRKQAVDIRSSAVVLGFPRIQKCEELPEITGKSIGAHSGSPRFSDQAAKHCPRVVLSNVREDRSSVS